MTPAGDVYGGGSPTGNVFYENGALGEAWVGTFLAADAGRNEIFSYQPARQGAGFALDRKIFMTSNAQAAVRRLRLRRRPRTAPARSRRCSGRPTSRSGPMARSTSATGSTRASAATRISTTRRPARSTGSRRRVRLAAAGVRRRTIEGLITALRSPAVNVRAIGFEGPEGARRGRRDCGGGAAERPEPVHPRPRDLSCCISSVPRAGSAPAPRSPTPIRRCASPPTARCAGPISTSCRSPRARARHRRGRAPRGRAVDARSAGGRVAGHPRRCRARLRRPGSQLSRSARHRRDAARRRRSTIGCARRSA